MILAINYKLNFTAVCEKQIYQNNFANTLWASQTNFSAIENIYLGKIRVDPVDKGFLLYALLLICNHTSSKVLFIWC